MDSKVNIQESYWKGKRVLVTGHTGFKGGYLCLWLHKLGAIVSGISLAPPQGAQSFFEKVDLKQVLENHIIFDLRHSVVELQNYIQLIQPEFVFHLAAMPLVRESYQFPVETFDTNIMGTVHLLEALRNCKSIKNILNITTDKCYENKEWVWGYRENDALGGKDPYSASKACSEIVTHAYYKSFYAPVGIGVATARGGNVYGGGDYSADRLFPDCIRAYEKQLTIELRYPSATRPWQYVIDVLAGYMLLAQKLMENSSQYSQAWNFAPDDSMHLCVHDFVKKVFYSLEYSLDNVRIIPNDNNLAPEAMSLVLSNHKVKKYLGPYQRWSIDSGIYDSVNWYKKSLVLTSQALREYTLSSFSSNQQGFNDGIYKRTYTSVNSAVL